MSKINTSDNIDWTWFNTVVNPDTSSVISTLITNIENIGSVIKTLEFGVEEQNQTLVDIEILLYTITGITNTSPHTTISQEDWYDIWLSQGQKSYFSFSINFIIEKVKTNQTGSLNGVITAFNFIMEFILYRHFSTPIPEGYKNSGNKPRLVDNKSEYYTIMTDALYSFLLNNGTGINGIGNNTISNMCSNFTRTTISKYLPIQKWCGCFAPESNITKLAKTEYPNSGSYTNSCDPLCIFPQAIKLVDNVGRNEECDSTLCIISRFDIENANLNGSINLKQNCPCTTKNQACFCIIDSSVESLLNKVQGPNGNSMAEPVTFKQYCPGARCLIEEPNGDFKSIECQNDNPSQTGSINSQTSTTSKQIRPNIWFLLFSIVLVFITLLQCARHIGFEPKFKVKGILKPKVKLSKNTRSYDIIN